MTISKDRRELYPALSGDDRKAVDAAFGAAFLSLQESGIRTQGDDRAENLVGAIARYIEECRS